MYDMTPALQRIQDVIAAGPFQDNWESLSKYTVPQWYKAAKFGIFVHWGLYSVAAFGNEWYSRNMYVKGSREYHHHISKYGAHKDFGYKDFLPMFCAERFNADEWLSLFGEAGVKYTVFVAEHHDGFQMYNSEISHWNIAEKGPCRDTMQELKEACKKHGLVYGASSHRAEHWFFMHPGREYESDIREPMERGDFYWPAEDVKNMADKRGAKAPSEEYLQDWLVRTCELVDKYQPKVIYFDWWIIHEAFRPYIQKFAAYYYNRAAEWGHGVVINYKHDSYAFGTAVPDIERGQFAVVQPYYWQTDTAIAKNSWGYTDGNDFKNPVDIVRTLVDVVSKNANFLLNVGPRADGTITQEEAAVLRGIGGWLRTNGEAIYDAEVYRYSSEGPTKIRPGQFAEGQRLRYCSKDIRFTASHGNIYAIVMKANPKGVYRIKTLAVADASKIANFDGIIRSVSVLGATTKPTWTQDGKGLHVQTDYTSEYPIVIKIEVE